MSTLSSYSKKFKYRHCIVLDLDYTLVDVDTTVMLAMFTCTKIRRFLFKVLSISILRFIIPVLNRILERDVYKAILLNMCIRHDENSFNNVVDKTYYEALNHLNASLVKMISRVNALKVLLTASIDIIAKRFAALGFDIVISSITEHRNGRVWCILDLYRKKHKILKILLKYCDKIIVVEDSPEPQYYVLNDVKVLKISYYVKR
jgi:phosphoserine phosphatase